MSTPIRTSFTSLRRSPFQALAAIAVLAVTYFVTTLIAVSVYGVNEALMYFETRPQAIAFLKTDAKEESISLLADKLKSDGRIKSVTIVNREEAMNLYKEATKDNPLLGELVSPSIFPPSIEFSVNELADAQPVLDEVKQDPIVDTVGFTANVGGSESVSTVIDRLKSISRALRLGGVIAVGILLTTSSLVLMVVMTMRTTMKRTEIESLSFLGATPQFIRTPIIFEALQYSFYGVVIGWAFALVLLMYLTPSLLVYFGEIPFVPRASSEFFKLFGVVLGFDMLSAIVIAYLGSSFAVSRSIRMIK